MRPGRPAVAWRARLHRLRGAGIWLALAGVFAASGVSTAGRVVGTRRHQENIAATMRDYARYAARTVAERWREEERAAHRALLLLAPPGAAGPRGAPPLDAVAARAPTRSSPSRWPTRAGACASAPRTRATPPRRRRRAWAPATTR